jgi:beta-galactosidase
LVLNGAVIGELPTTRAQQFKATFAVPYAPGELVAIGLENGREVERFVLKTAGKAQALAAFTDRQWVMPNGQDLVFVQLEVHDAAGTLQPDAAPAVELSVSGPATIAAVGSADLTSKETYQANPRRLFRGRGVVVLRTTEAAGLITLTAKADGLTPATVTVKSTP